MNKPLQSWDLLETFLAVMREGSLSGAARALGAAQPTVRRHIEALEANLGDVLFTRSPHGLAPTDTARRTLPLAEEMAATAQAFMRSASGAPDADKGTVRITASDVVGVEILPGLLAPLMVRRRGLAIELAPDNRNADLLRRDADIAVRMLRPTQTGLVARRLGSLELGLFASANYLAARPAPRALGDLAREHVLIGPDRNSAVLAFATQTGIAQTREDFAFRTDSDLAQLAAIRSGLGIGVMQVGLAGPGLRRVLPKIRFDLDLWLVMHEDLRGVARVRIVFDHLADALSAHARRYSSAEA